MKLERYLNYMICKSDNIQGYRMGGDEFLVVAENISEEEIIEIKKEWEEALEKINENTMLLIHKYLMIIYHF